MRDKTPQSLWIEDLDNFLEELEVGCVVKSLLNEMSIHSFAFELQDVSNFGEGSCSRGNARAWRNYLPPSLARVYISQLAI